MALLDEQPYIGYPQMGRRRAMPNRDVEMNQGLLRGASYYPYDLLGSPIDLINMALKPMGMGSQKPVMGSDYLQSLAQQYGLSQQPTGSNAENVARLAMSAMNPATGARAVGRVIEPTAQALAPKAYGLLEDYMVKSGGMIPLTAYHGSPYRFDKFDPTKVGAGEGAQVYGHGMYFAEHPAVAMPYSKIVPSGMSATPNRQLFGKDVDPLTPEYKVSQLVDEMGVAKAKKFISDWAKDPLPDQVGYVDNLQSIVSNVAKKSDAKNLGASNMYKVDIPDEKIPKMLNWDIPLSEQSKSVQDIAWKYKDALKNQTEMKGLKSIWDLDGADLYGVMQRYTMQDNGNLIKKNVDIKDVSEIMNSSDIPGIRYMNYQGKTSEGANTSNYVVFDPTDVKILERNKKAIEGLLD
jgi:hypothetical protein